MAQAVIPRAPGHRSASELRETSTDVNRCSSSSGLLDIGVGRHGLNPHGRNVKLHFWRHHVTGERSQFADTLNAPAFISHTSRIEYKARFTAILLKGAADYTAST